MMWEWAFRLAIVALLISGAILARRNGWRRTGNMLEVGNLVALAIFSLLVVVAVALGFVQH